MMGLFLSILFMPKFGATSCKRLNSCHVDLQKIFNEVIKTSDSPIFYGYKIQQEQNFSAFKAYVMKVASTLLMPR